MPRGAGVVDEAVISVDRSVILGRGMGGHRSPLRYLPEDAFERVDAVLTFVAGHLTVQDYLDEQPDRRLSQWIALITSTVGQAATAVLQDARDPDDLRSAVAWFACACGDAMRAHAMFARGETSIDRDQQLRALHDRLIAALMSDVPWSPTLQVAFVIETVGRLVETAMPLLCDEPEAHGPWPRFPMDVASVLRRLAGEDPSGAQPPADDQSEDPRAETAWALEDVVRATASAAVLLHPGGPVGLPPLPADA